MEESDQHLVNAAALVVYEIAECNLSRRERCVGFPLDELLRQSESLRPGKPYDTDTASARWSRDSNNRVFRMDGSQFRLGDFSKSRWPGRAAELYRLGREHPAEPQAEACGQGYNLPRAIQTRERRQDEARAAQGTMRAYRVLRPSASERSG